MLILITILIVSAALILGAWLGVSGWLPKQVEGFLVAVAGGALIVSVMSELIEPAFAHTTLFPMLLCILIGGLIFVGLNYWVDHKMKNSGGSGLLLAVTTDGIPENLALGVALISSNIAGVAALAGSIFLSNLPEAAGGADDMKQNGHSTLKIMVLWSATAVLLSVAALIGYYTLANVGQDILSYIRLIAAGAVTASLATEVFPKAYEQDRHFAGIGVVLGLILAVGLSDLG